VTTLIHDKTELGAPPMYINPTSVLDYEYYNSKQFMDSSNNGFVYQLLYKLSQSGGEQLDIKELLDSFPLADSESRIGSADIYVSVYRDEEQYKVFPSGNIFSPFASRTAGRFLYGLDTDMQDEILTDHEQKMSKVMKDDNLVNVTL